MTRASDLAKLLGAGATILDGTTISTADNTAQLILQSTDTDASSGPQLTLKRDSSSPADNDFVGRVKYIAENDASQEVAYVDLLGRIIDASDGTEDASFFIKVMNNGSDLSTFSITPTEVAINDDSADIDFRVESNTDANMLFVDGGNNRVGIGTNAPTRRLQIKDTSADMYIGLEGGTSNTVGILFGDTDNHTQSRIQHNNSDNSLKFSTVETERMRITSAGDVGIGTSSPSTTYTTNLHLHAGGNGSALHLTNSTSGSAGSDGFHIIGFQNDAYLFNRESSGNMIFGTANDEKVRIDSSGNVGIGDSSPDAKLDVHGNVVFGDGGGFDMNINGTRHQFSIGGTERMRIDSSGRLLLGTTTATGFKIDCDTNSGSGIFVQRIGSGLNGFLTRPSANHSYNAMRFDNVSASIVGTISVSTSGTTYNTSSDYRLKENVEDMTDATSRLKKLQPKRFNFISDETNTLVDGFLAHEAQAVVPECVTGEKDATNEDGSIKPQGIDQSKLVPLLVKTIQELEARITALEGA